MAAKRKRTRRNPDPAGEVMQIALLAGAGVVGYKVLQHFGILGGNAASSPSATTPTSGTYSSPPVAFYGSGPGGLGFDPATADPIYQGGAFH